MNHFRCRPLFFALFLALALCGAARAEDESVLNGYLRDHQNGVSVTCWYEDENDAENVESLLCAIYDGNGALLTVADLNPKSGTQTVVAPCDTALVDHAKLFAADASHKPLCPALTLKPAAANSDVPQFMSGYPVVSENGVSVSGSAMARVKVMTDRACRLYWALYKKDAGYATRQKFMSNNLPGSEKHSMMVMGANQSALVTLTGLDDETAYDLDLWLTNSDFTASSYITRLSFSSVDVTPPAFRMAPNVSAAQEHSVTVQYSLNENSTLYWILLEGGSKFPSPPTGGGAITADYAVKQLTAGNGGLNHGRANAKANATGSFQIQGLTAQKTYDIWYVAKDAAGNCSEFRVGTPDSGAPNDPRDVCLLTAYTLDRQPPTVAQELTKCPDDSPTTPYADTNVRLIFNEAIRRFSTGEALTDLYDAVRTATNDAARAAAKEKLAAFLRETVVLQSGSGTAFAAVPERTADESEWTVDYRNATVAWEDENLVLTFPTSDDANSALKLYGGKTYRFLLQDLSDLSENLNRITSLTTDPFTTMPAQILFNEITLNNLNYPPGLSVVDLAFTAVPVAVSRAESDAAWDLLFWTDTTCAFEVYRRSRPSTSAVYDQPWTKMQNPMGTGGQGTALIPITADAGTVAGQSMHIHLCQLNGGSVPTLNSLEDGRVYEYAVRFLEIDGETDRGLWDADVLFDATAVAGSASALVNLAANLTKARLASAKAAGNVQEIGAPAPFHMTRTFIATSAPSFANGAPSFVPGDTSVSMWFQMTRAGTVHYLLAPAGGNVSAKDAFNRTVNWDSRYQEIPESGEDAAHTPFTLSSPSWLNIVNQRFSGAGVRVGSLEVDSRGASCTVTGLLSKTHYFAYFVLQGASGSVYSTAAQLFRFDTLEAAPPSVQISLRNPVATFSTNQESVVDYAVVDMDGDTLDPLINNVFWNNTPSGGRQANSSYMRVDNVLQAMSMDTGAGSVFDVYATTDYKNRVAAYIRQSLMDGSSVIGIGKGVRVSPTASLSIDCSLLPMLEGHKYAVLTVTHNVDGDADVFRAVSPVTPPDTTPPLITNITTNLTMDGNNSIELNTCSGTATLTFDSELCYFDAGTLKTLDLGPHYSTLRQDTYKPAVDIASSSPATQITVSSGQVAQVNHATSVINLTLTNAAPGATITFPTLLCDEYGNMHTSPLTVKLKVTTTNTGYDAAGNAVYIHRPELEISSSWDGRTAQ